MPSRLLALPAELRVLIYEYTFGDNTPEKIELFAAVQNHPKTALLRTCRKIYSEAQPIHAAASARYRDSKMFTVMLDPAHNTGSYFVELLERCESLTFPFHVRNVYLTWLNSTASVQLTFDENATLHMLVKQGKVPGILLTVLDSYSVSAFMPYVVRGEQNARGRSLSVYLVLIFVMRMTMAVADGDGSRYFVDRAICMSKSRLADRAWQFRLMNSADEDDVSDDSKEE